MGINEVYRSLKIDHMHQRLMVHEKLGLLDRLIEAGIPGKRMMPGTGCCALTDSVELSRHAVQNGVGGVLMLPPFYYKGVSDDGLYGNFAEIIERVGDDRLRIYLYHIPQVSQCTRVRRYCKVG